MYGYVRPCRAVNGYVRRAMHGYVRLRTAVYGYVRLCRAYVRQCTDLYDRAWLCTTWCGCVRLCRAYVRLSTAMDSYVRLRRAM